MFHVRFSKIFSRVNWHVILLNHNVSISNRFQKHKMNLIRLCAYITLTIYSDVKGTHLAKWSALYSHPNPKKSACVFNIWKKVVNSLFLSSPRISWPLVGNEEETCEKITIFHCSREQSYMILLQSRRTAAFVLESCTFLTAALRWLSKHLWQYFTTYFGCFP